MKYIVSKVDGSLVDERAVYYVLRIDKGASSEVRREVARHVLRLYKQNLERIDAHESQRGDVSNGIVAHDLDKLLKETE